MRLIKEGGNMKIRCEYCGGVYDNTDPKCPLCGAPSPSDTPLNDSAGPQKSGKKAPETIEELKQWYQAANLPPYETTRFFIGEDYRGPKAFGIYRDEMDGSFIVYKNKADGSRAVRYSGDDEAHAVNEIYLKLKEEMRARKQGRGTVRSGGGSGNSRKKSFLPGIFFAAFIAYSLITFIIGIFAGRNNGYYKYRGDTWYRQNDIWYYFDPLTYDWFNADDAGYEVPEVLQDSDIHSDYFEGSDWSADYGVTDWESTDFASDSSRDSDDDDSWDSNDSWDSGDTDWDSDW